jgi:hypothetical protein
MKNKITIFYSWQTDLPNSTNRQAIRSGLLDASVKIEEQFSESQVIIDEATRDESGSPDISSSILSKINKCDIFVCDISIVNSNSALEIRRTPNPNVLFELGYAVAVIGWSRILLMYNQEYGNIETDIPFDIRKHRVTTYKLSESDKNKREIKAKLCQTLRDAISSVIEKNPIKQSSLDHDSPEKIHKARDIKTLEGLLSQVHFTTIDEMYFSLPQTVHSKFIYFWEVLNSIVSNSLFHLYDEEVNEIINSIHAEWGKCMSHGEYYHSDGLSEKLTFRHDDAMRPDEKKERVYDEIEYARVELRSLLRSLYKIIRTRFLEINVENLDTKAWVDYLNHKKRMASKIK